MVVMTIPKFSQVKVRTLSGRTACKSRNGINEPEFLVIILLSTPFRTAFSLWESVM